MFASRPKQLNKSEHWQAIRKDARFYWIPALEYWHLPEAKKDVGGYLMATTAGKDLIGSTVAFLLLQQRKTLKYCPGLVDHYNTLYG